MAIKYDKNNDTLTIILGQESYETGSFETGDFTVGIGEWDDLTSITIANAKQFITRALTAGIKIEGIDTSQFPKKGKVWHDADSSMISAFGYDESEGTLDVAFHRSGTYRYYDVPIHIFEGLRDASSQGRYMRDMIIDIYNYEKKIR